MGVLQAAEGARLSSGERGSSAAAAAEAGAAAAAAAPGASSDSHSDANTVDDDTSRTQRRCSAVTRTSTCYDSNKTRDFKRR